MKEGGWYAYYSWPSIQYIGNDGHDHSKIPLFGYFLAKLTPLEHEDMRPEYTWVVKTKVDYWKYETAQE